MKCTIPEISWHNRDPVLSVDIQPANNQEFYRLASGGTDCHVLIWYLKIQKNGAVDIDIVSDLNRHQKAVNVVRWSPSGQYLATGDDDANIIIWNLKVDNIPLLDGETSDKETWVVTKVLRGHKEDVYDICWSPTGLKLISGSIDNTAILWDFTKGLNEHILSDHKGFVQGVTWDPKGEFIATLSSDRVCRVFDNTGRVVKTRLYKGMLPLPESHALFNKEIKYFHDDTFKSYFRRLSFSPDGSLLIVPSGCMETEEYKTVKHTTLIFTLDCLKQPAAILPSPKQETVATRCCPILFELHSEGVDPIVRLPYRIVIAVATDNDIVLYDTQQFAPFAHFQKIHYTRITDLTWASDGLLLIASSTDGFCTLITFDPDELGVQYVKEESETEESILDISGCEELDKTESVNKKNIEIEVKTKKPNILEQWAIRKSKQDMLDDNTAKEMDEKLPLADQQPIEVKKKRIAPIRIGDAQNKEIKNSAGKTVERGQKAKSAAETVTKDIKSKSTSFSKRDRIKNGACKVGVDIPGQRLSNTTPSKKQKKVYTPSSSSPLLNFLKTTTTPPNKHLQCNESPKTLSNTTDVIEISDDDSKDSNLEHKKSTTEDAADSNTVTETYSEKILNEIRKKRTNPRNTITTMIQNRLDFDKENMGIDSKDDVKHESKVNTALCKEENMETDQIVRIDDDSSSNKKLVPSQSDIKKDIAQPTTSKVTTTISRFDYDKGSDSIASSGSKTMLIEKENVSNSSEDHAGDAKFNIAECGNVKAATAENDTLTKKTVTPRRIKLVTLSSPKRKKV